MNANVLSLLNILSQNDSGKEKRDRNSPDVVESLLKEKVEGLPLPLLSFIQEIDYIRTYAKANGLNFIWVWKSLFTAFVQTKANKYLVHYFYDWVIEIREYYLDFYVFINQPATFIGGLITGSIFPKFSGENWFSRLMKRIKLEKLGSLKKDYESIDVKRDFFGRHLFYVAIPLISIYLLPKLTSRENKIIDLKRSSLVLASMVGFFQGFFSGIRLKKKVKLAKKNDFSLSPEKKQFLREKILLILPFYVKESTIQAGVSLLPEFYRAFVIWRHLSALTKQNVSQYLQLGILSVGLFHWAT